MDNLTHSLVGLLVGETAAVASTATNSGMPAANKRTAILGLMLVGSNFPDFDLLYTTLSGGKLNYLLHHRGYTHTVIGAILATALMLGVCELWMRRHQWRLTTKDRVQLFLVALLAPLLHIALDFTNSYGVHPFWPVYDGWLYGDSVFIVEPLLWSIAAPLAFILHSRWARYAIRVALVGGIGLCLFSGMVPLLFALMHLIATIVLLALGKYAKPRTALFAGIGGWMLITFVFVVAGRRAGTTIESLAAEQFTQAITLDHVLTPMPVNPLCWDVILVQRQADEVVLRRATMSLAPGVLRADRCPAGISAGKITAPLRPVPRPDSTTIKWRGEVATPLSTLRELVAKNCQAQEFMQFGRAPWASEIPTAGGQAAPQATEWVIGDLRYDREPGPGLAELVLGIKGEVCSKHRPPWLPPRGDLIETETLPP